MATIQLNYIYVLLPLPDPGTDVMTGRQETAYWGFYFASFMWWTEVLCSLHPRWPICCLPLMGRETVSITP